MRDKIKKRESESKAARHLRMTSGLRVLHAVMCVFLAITLCASCAFLHIDRQRRELTRSFGGDDGKVRIYIDQGHNPYPHHNSGAEGNGLYEQDVTFTIGCLLAELLEEDGRFEGCLSRPDESTVLGSDIASSLGARVSGAEEFGADYFISLHINAYTQESVNGIEVFVSDGASETYAFATSLLDGMLSSTELNDRGLKKSSELYVLENTSMPAVLLEMGFISNPEDATLLSEHPELFAKGIYDGIVDYFETPYTSEITILLGTIGVSLSTCIILMIIFFKKIKKA